MVAPFINIHEAETGGSLCSLGHSGLHIKFHNSQGYIVEKLCLRQKYLAIVFLGDCFDMFRKNRCFHAVIQISMTMIIEHFTHVYCQKSDLVRK